MNTADLKDRIAKAKTAKDRAIRAYNWLVKQCPHHIVCDRCKTDTDKEGCINPTNGEPDDFGHGGANCTICGQSFPTWYCHKSPDRTCYYFSDNREGKTVTLVGGKVVELDSRHDTNGLWETTDYCLFCGQPDERK